MFRKVTIAIVSRLHPSRFRAAIAIIGALTMTASSAAQTPSASSSLSGLGPARATDGDPGTFWSSAAHLSPSFTEWIAVNFSETTSIAGVRLTPRIVGTTLAFPVDYQIQSTTNGSTWTLVPGESYTNQPPPSATVTHEFASPVDVLGIRVLATRLGSDDFGNYYFQLAEIDPLLAGASAEVDLGSVEHLAGVRLTPLDSSSPQYTWPIDYYVEYSYDENGDHWFPLDGAEYSSEPEPSGIIELTFDAKVLARRVRVVATEVGPSGADLQDFESIGIEAVTGSAVFPFETSMGQYFDAQLNMLWAVYGNYWDSASSSSQAAVSFGFEPAWNEWLGLKYSWSDSTTDELEFLRDALIVSWPQRSDGYMWSWGTQEKWPTGDGSYHQENNAKYILGAWRIWSWTRDDSFFDQVDGTTASAAPGPDVSEGRTVREKLREAMLYMENELDGAAGGTLLMDNGAGNTGRTDGSPTSYWDNWPFGYHDAYTNIYYLAALEAMADMEEYWGNSSRAATLRARAQGCRQQYDSLFWDSAKGRYIATIDIDGIEWDFGGTFHNLEALAYGLGDSGKAAAIFDWLDGARTISGDTSTGADIYQWGFAPRANTLAVESTGSPYWWFDLNGAIRVDTNAQWGTHLENGGAIFYTSYYDMMARLRWGDVEGAATRLEAIVDEFRTDQLRRDPNVWQFGIVGEFPESGLVPCALVHGFAGIQAGIEGLEITPRLPAAWDYVTVRDIRFAERTLTITARPNEVTVSNSATSPGPVYVGPTAVSPGAETTTLLEDGSVTVGDAPFQLPSSTSYQWMQLK